MWRKSSCLGWAIDAFIRSLLIAMFLKLIASFLHDQEEAQPATATPEGSAPENPASSSAVPPSEDAEPLA
jgi:hypothetical protein